MYVVIIDFHDICLHIKLIKLKMYLEVQFILPGESQCSNFIKRKRKHLHIPVTSDVDDSEIEDSNSAGNY